jgi:hypothetical protein
MPVNLPLTKENGHGEHAGQKMVHTYIKGELTESDRNRIGAEAIQMLREHHLIRSIWDVREAVLAYSLTSVHLAASNVDSFGFQKGTYAAVIYQNNELEFEHAANVVHNRGIKNVAYFQDLEEGIQWLADRE